MLWPGIAFGFPSESNFPMRAEQDRAGERRERALVVHDGRAGEVLYAEREQPAVRMPDPVRDDRVDEREDDAEREVDPLSGSAIAPQTIARETAAKTTWNRQWHPRGSSRTS